MSNFLFEDMDNGGYFFVDRGLTAAQLVGNFGNGAAEVVSAHKDVCTAVGQRVYEFTEHFAQLPRLLLGIKGVTVR